MDLTATSGERHRHRLITVASFNLHWGRRLRSARPYDVVDACAQLDADVLALQEVWRPDGGTSLAEQVAAALDYELHETWACRVTVDPVCRVVGHAGAPVGDGDSGQALLVRRGIAHGPVTVQPLGGFLFDDSDRAVISVELDVDGTAITVAGSHFPHLEHISPLLRWRLRRALPEPSQPAVVMGDFNMWGWVTRFVLPGWRRAVSGATWPAPRPVFQIDHLMATPSVVVEDAEVVRAGGSDHLPIRARITTRPRR